jgi:hypothetical protein
MRDAISDHIQYHETYTESGFVPQYLRDALSITGPDALREIQARTLEESAKTDFVYGISERLRQMAAAKRKGE